MGFPDIQTLEPLARALDVSLLELMQSRLIQEQTVTSEEASAAVADALTLAGGNRLTRILRWTEKASAIFAMAAMGFLSIILDKYVVGTWMRTASKLALVLMFLTTGAVYFLRQAAQSPSRPTRYQAHPLGTDRPGAPGSAAQHRAGRNGGTLRQKPALGSGHGAALRKELLPPSKSHIPGAGIGIRARQTTARRTPDIVIFPTFYFPHLGFRQHFPSEYAMIRPTRWDADG